MFNGYFDVALADQDLTRPGPWLRRPVTTTPMVIAALLAAGLLVRRRLR
jgi:hypothetical protein